MTSRHKRCRAQLTDLQLQDAASDVEPEYDEPSDSEISGTDLSFVLQTHTRPRAQSRSITSGHMKHLWDVFVQNIDPLTKIVHVPTLRSTLDQANEVDAPISKPLSALLAAICSTAVMSLNDCDCLKDLGDSRAVLLSKYIKTTQTALTRARFIETTDLRVLQALALHLLSIQETSTPRTLWGLAGVAIRISQAMGLDRDGLYLGLSHFESELRRRLWWFLKTYDHRFADLCGLSKFRDLNLNPESPNWPANVDDAHLHPEMSTMPEAPRGLTDAAFIAVKYEFVSFAAGRVANLRQQGKTADEIDQQLPHEGGQEATQVMLDEVQELLETKYLRYCDPSKPLHLMTSLMARAAINTIQFLAHHPRHWPDRQGAASDERETAWKISIKLMEQLNILQSNPLLKPYAWYAAFVMQFHALIHVLDTLYEEPLVEGYQKAWDLIAGIYESNTGMISDTRKPIHLAIGGLCLKAYKKRTTALQQKGMAPVRDPGYIVELQRQRATAYRMRRTPKTSRCGVGQSSMREGHSDSANDSTTLGSDQARDASHISRSDGLDSSSHGYANKASYGPSELGTNSSGTMMDFGLDLAGWDTLEDEDGKSHIPWEQWDAWVAASGDMDGGLSWL